MRFLNWQGPDGLETIDELSRADFPPGREGRRAYAAELARLRGEYALAGMSAYWSGRPCAARRLAELINGRTARARDVARKIGPGTSGRFTVDGVALKPFRARHGV